MNSFESLKRDIPEQDVGLRLDQALAKLFPEYSRSLLTRWLKLGALKVNGGAGKPKSKVFGGEQIVLTVPQRDVTLKTDKAQNLPLNIAYEDEDLLVINKPESFVVHPGAGRRDTTLLNALLYYDKTLEELPRAGIVHRLDKDTTGLLLVAKNLRTLTALTSALQDRDINRKYLALVQGNVISGNTIETCYGRDPHNRLKMAVTQNGKHAITLYRVNKRLKNFTLLDVKLITGRTHQIRVHMAHINHPIIGDSLYLGRAKIPPGISEELKNYLKTFKRQALHAYFLEFIHPITKKNVQITCELPADYAKLLHLLNEEQKLKE